jgi:hypothetical protein
MRLGEDGADTNVGGVRIPVDEPRQRTKNAGSGEGQLKAENALLDEHVAHRGEGRDIRRAEYCDHLASGKPLAERRSPDRRDHGA